MGSKKADKAIDMHHPLIQQIADMADAATGASLLIVYPEDAGWKQLHGNARVHAQEAFCKLIQSSEEGAQHCRMCHVMMTVPACNGAGIRQRCHAGVAVMVCPAADGASDSMAVLSSCLCSSEEAWAEVKQRGEKLGINLQKLRKAFDELPQLDEQRLGVLKSAMQAMGYALNVVRQNQLIMTEADKRPADLITTLEQLFANSSWASGATQRADGNQPLLIKVVCELIQQRPDLPLTVKEIAAAARLTPNHFTTLFHEHAGKPFNEYLTEQRLLRARKLLRNPTLGINEIARLCGYEDAGYFARRFHKVVGISPREWRKHPGS